ncbi:15316_t:CDS:2 [Funneliformis caledonium]|uniref:Phosphatidylinositol 4-kinase n=1 Tax=Funneliformis caledonium TaxID=1117310 RepID=A0A9N8V590_9GLOM|nr:15316_t:CDS:2 [Funneliformis caledonium]
MIRSNNYIKLQQEPGFNEERDSMFNTLSENEHRNVECMNHKQRYQKRSLSETGQKFPISTYRTVTPYENEHDNTRNSDGVNTPGNSIDDNSSAHRTDRSAWSQFSKKLGLKGKEKLDKTELEIYSSVFIPTLQDWKPSAPPLTSNHKKPLTRQEFIEIVDSVKSAISINIQPTRICQGSSGSYFCRNVEGNIVGVFKPKNEEPYGQLNPKWTKWIHRNLFPCFFGRSCLIPNLGYISEAAASLLDHRLLLNIVPVTEVVRLSSPSFHYDYLDRRAAKSKKNPKPLPEKIGSFQVFLEGFKDANVFLREHPWPDHHAATTLTDSGVVIDDRQHRPLNALICGRSMTIDEEGLPSESHNLGRRFKWTPELQLQFREQFEKLVILDYLMRNTDRGSDNWMIKYCEKDCIMDIPPASNVMKVPDISTNGNASIHPKGNEAISIPPQGTNGDAPPPLSPDGSELSSSFSEPPSHTDNQALTDSLDVLYDPISSDPPAIPQSASNSSQNYKLPYPHIHVAAIDNGLAFPFKHPDQWRSYPYGWLHLPEALIGKPFTTNTRNHFLSMLSNPKWWKETVFELHRLFSMDADFEPGMFEKQIAVLKGQGWNIVEILKQPDKGPIQLCEKQNAMVWNIVETIEIPLEHDVNNRNANGIDINSGRSRGVSGLPTTVNGEREEISIPPNQRSISSGDDSSLSTSAPATSSFSAASSKQRWSRFKEKFAFDSGSRNKGKSSLEEKRTKRVIVEKLELVKGGTPFFKWC